MSYLLDTDTLSLLSNGHPRVAQRVRQHPTEELWVSVVTVEEMLTGWQSLLRKRRSDRDEAATYARFTRTVQTLGKLTVVTFDETAIARFHELTSLKLNVGRNDLRIAATALEHGLVVVTRNLRDFERVPGLRVENWAD